MEYDIVDSNEVAQQSEQRPKGVLISTTHWFAITLKKTYLENGFPNFDECIGLLLHLAWKTNSFIRRYVVELDSKGEPHIHAILISRFRLKTKYRIFGWSILLSELKAAYNINKWTEYMKKDIRYAID